jgi:hypothetical protein
MLFRRTVGLVTSYLLLQSTLGATGGATCTSERQVMPEASATMNHAGMRAASDASPIRSTVKSVLTRQVPGESASDNEAATCVLMHSCTSSSQVVVAYVAAPLIQSFPSRLVLSWTTPRSHGKTPDVPPPRTWGIGQQAGA